MTTTELEPADTVPPDTTDEPALLAWLAGMRTAHPVWRDRYGMYHVFRQADVLGVLRDPARFSSETSRLAPSAKQVSRGMLTQIDPPEHRRLRSVVSTAFTPKRVADLEPRIREITRRLLDAVPDAGSFDLVDSLAFPLPVTVIAEMLGLPDDDHPLFRTWADRLFSMQVDDPSDPSLGERVAEAMADIRTYLTARVQERRAAPTDDLISALVEAGLDDEEGANFSLLLLLAGHITTTVLLGNAVRTFAEHPGVWEGLRADPSTIPAAIEEVLRLRSPFVMAGRVTTEPVEIAGVTIPADRFVVTWMLSANRDERAFAEPEAFVLDRGIGGGAQTAFGHGVHFCLGAPLARLEGRVALEELTARYSALSPTEVSMGALEPYPRGVLGVRRLPVKGVRSY
ncbi:cytochrome P450 [Actinomycetospora termitidis]|uniref:Cytochrome P450 n=1 Tax=Actinomycetospora termitidis TaxID=3053470 RepID=A0ABT7MEW4_9PSEU|nr:cytochrome P450 [Actinomycetospora sp. Odt1-22]MDL5159205.1 cytochrome P450 [Actinomycetospora sp. Odt1-22]